MQQIATSVLRRFAPFSALAMLVAGCAGGQGDFAPDLFGKSVSSMQGPLIETTSFEAGAPSAVGTQRPPRTFFYSGAADDPNANYWMREKSKAAIPDASRVIPDANIRAYLHSIAQRLLKQAPPGAPEVQVHVFADTAYRAFARESGDVYVSLGVLAQADTEDEVAVLLGHEIGHLLLRHHDKDRMFEKQRKATSLALQGTLMTVAVLAKLNERGMVGTDKQSLLQDTAAATAAKMAADFVATDIVNASWNRTQENDADLIGIDLAVRAGYDPYASAAGFAHLIEAAQNRKTQLSALADKAEQRLQDLETTMTNSVEVGRVDLQPVLQAGVDTVSDAATAAVEDSYTFISGNYQSPVDRSDRAIEYLDLFYAEVDQGSETAYATKKERLRIVPINNAYREVERALVAIADKDFKGALAIMQQAYESGLINDHPTPRYVEALAYRSLNQPQKALSALDRVSPRIPLPVEGYIMKAELEAELKSERGSSRGAMATLDKGAEIYGAEAMQPARITVLAALDRSNEAEAALEDCEQLSSVTLKQCKLAAKESGVGVQTAATSASEGGSEGGVAGKLRGVQESLGESLGF